MKTDFIFDIESTPKLTTKKCKLIAFLLRLCLQLSTYVITLVTWYLYDYFIAIGLFFLSYIVMGIVRSTLRNSVIPKKQQEYNYNDQAIAQWYTARRLCIELDYK